MGQIKCLLALIFLEIWELAAIKVWYVIPDNSTNASCPSQPCATLSQYLLDNGTLPVVSNVEYHFLPGEHHVPVNMVLQNLHNFSIVGTVSKISSAVVLIGCFHSYVLKIDSSHYVKIKNVKLKLCYNPQLQNNTYFTSLYISWCFSCIIENVSFQNFGIIGHNLIGKSYLNEINILCIWWDYLVKELCWHTGTMSNH